MASSYGEIEISDWGDEPHTFNVARVKQLRELQDKCDAGPPVILHRLLSNQWKLDDVRETLRLGLIGGGMEPRAALALVVRYVDERPLSESVQPAAAVIMAAIFAKPKDTPDPKGQGATEAEGMPMNSPTENSRSPVSTETPPPSADSTLAQ